MIDNNPISVSHRLIISLNALFLPATATGLTLDHFYGDKTKLAKPVEVVDAEEDAEDMLSAIKRRRKTAEERKQKESEERLM